MSHFLSLASAVNMRIIIQVAYSYNMLTLISINKSNSQVDIHRTSKLNFFDASLLIDLLFPRGEPAFVKLSKFFIYITNYIIKQVQSPWGQS